jgi:hypothetical protein
MAILRAGPWGNLSDSFQNTGSSGAYPVNIAKGNWPTQNWAAYYEVEVAAGCATPATATSNDHLVYGGPVTMDRVAGECQEYYWSDPSGPYYGEADLIYSGGYWTYTESTSSAPYASYGGGTDPDDPTGTYYGTFDTRTIT